MTRTLTLSRTPEVKPLSEWGTIAVELLGTQTRFVEGARWRHRVIAHGSGEPLVLIHGGGGHAETFARNMRTLGRHFRVLAIDALYHGFTSKEPYDDVLRHDLQVEALVDLLDALGLPWAHVSGESMGAWVAFDFGMRHPKRAGKIVMNTGVGRVRLKRTGFAPTAHDMGELSALSTAAILTPAFETVRRRMEWLVAAPERMTDEMVELRLRLYDEPEIARAMRRYFKAGQDAEDVWNLQPIWEEEDVRRSFKPEALVFWTEHNPGEGPDMGEYFASVIPGCRWYLMEDAAHWPQWEKPEEHDQVLIDFILGGRGR